jgi:hypothetical protein
MKKLIALFAVAAMFAACNNSSETAAAAVDSAAKTVDTAAATVSTMVDTAAAKVDSAAGAIVDSAKKKAADVKEAVKK